MPVTPHPVASYALLVLSSLILLFSLYKAIQDRHRLLRLLGWMTLADASFVGLGFACAGAGGSTAAYLLLIYNGAARLLAALCLARMGGRAESFAPHALKGMGRQMPVTATLFALAMFAALGIGPFLPPDAKLFALHAPLASGLWLAPAIMTLSNALMVILTVPVVHGIWLDKGGYENSGEAMLSPAQAAPLLLCATLILMSAFAHDFVAFCGSLAGEDPKVLPRITQDWHPATLVPFFGAFVTWLIALKRPRAMRVLPPLLLLVSFFLLLPDTGLSPISRFFALVCTGIGTLAALYSAGYIHAPDGASPRAENNYFFFFLLLFSALNGIATSANLGSLFVFWELMTLASYVLVAFENTDDAHAAAKKYMVMCCAASAVMLPGLLLISANLGSLDIHDLTTLSPALSPALATVILLLALVGFGVKAGLVPGHSWLPAAHPAAPSSVSGPLSGVITKTGIFGLAQLLFAITGISLAGAGAVDGPGASVGALITFLGVMTMLYGEFMALQHTDIKRILAYSTMGQVGEITLTLGLCTSLAVTGAMMHLLNHAVMKDLLFLGSGIFILRAGGRDLKDLAGLGRAMPLTAACMIIGLLSIMGLPPFAGFMSKYMMIYAIAAKSPFLAGVMLLASLAGCVYYTRIIRTLIFEPYTGPPVERPSLSMAVPLGVLAFLTILLGLFPDIGLSLVVPVVVQAAGEAALEALPSLTIIWPVFSLILMLGAFIPVLLRKDPRKAGLAAAFTLLAASAGVVLFGQHLDTLSFWFALLAPLAGSVNMFYAVGYMDHSHTQWRFYAFFLVMCAGLTGVAASSDLFNFFLFWEIMSSWSLYFVIVHEENPDALREGFKYFFFNVLGAAFLFLGVALLSFWSGGPDFARVASVLPDLPAWQSGLALTLMATGFIMKAAQLPFRIDIQMHPATAPTPVSGYISSVLLKSALFGLAKLFFAMGGGLALAGAAAWFDRALIMDIALWIGGITIVMAATYAVFQTDVKLVLIYSTVSQLGYMVTGIALGTSLGVAGGLLHLVNHLFFKDLLFLVAGSLIYATHKQDMNLMGGLGGRMPWTLACFAIGALCVIGVPPASGFTSKWIIYHALMERGEVLLAVLSLVGSVITLAYFAKMLHLAFLGRPSADLEQVREAPRIMLIPMAVMAGGCVVLSVFPGLALLPINAVLAELALPPLDVAPWGLASGKGAWNATTATALFAVAGAGGWFALRFLSPRLRNTSVHTCGIPPEELNLRTTARDLYTAPVDALALLGRNLQKRFRRLREQPLGRLSEVMHRNGRNSGGY